VGLKILVPSSQDKRACGGTRRKQVRGTLQVKKGGGEDGKISSVERGELDQRDIIDNNATKKQVKSRKKKRRKDGSTLLPYQTSCSREVLK